MGDVGLSTAFVIGIGVLLAIYFVYAYFKKPCETPDPSTAPKPQDDHAKLIAAITAAIQYHKQK